MGQCTCAGTTGRPCAHTMSPSDLDPHLQCPTCRGQSCSRGVKHPICTSWTESQLSACEARKPAYRMGGVMSSLGGSLLTLSSVQAETHGEQVPNAPQPRRYHGISPLSSESSLPLLSLQQPSVAVPGFSQVSALVAISMGFSFLPSFLATNDQCNATPHPHTVCTSLCRLWSPTPILPASRFQRRSIECTGTIGNRYGL